MRRFPTRWAVLVAGTAVLLLAPLPLEGRAWKNALDLAHIFVGALSYIVAAALLRAWTTWPPGARRWVALGLALAAGPAIEKVQGLLGRHASWQDAGAHAAGALAWVLIRAAVRAPALPAPARAGAHALAFLVLAAAAWLPARGLLDTWRQHQDAPRLASFEDDLELSRWTFLEARAHRTSRHATHGNSSLAVHLDAGRYPGASLVWPLPDWTGRTHLRADVHLDAGPALEVIVKVQDREHDDTYEDRSHTDVTLQPGPNRLTIPLEAIRTGPRTRALDLTRVAVVQVFVDGLDTPRVLHLDNLRLE